MSGGNSWAFRTGSGTEYHLIHFLLLYRWEHRGPQRRGSSKAMELVEVSAELDSRTLTPAHPLRYLEFFKIISLTLSLHLYMDINLGSQ